MRAKSAALGMAAAVAFSGAAINVANAAACGTTTLNNWLSPTFSCTVGDKLFSGFSYASENANVNSASGVTVKPSSDVDGLGLAFNAGWNNTFKSNGDIAIGFTVATTSGAALIHDAYVHFGGATGTVTDVETLSAGPFTAKLVSTTGSAASDITLTALQSSLKVSDDLTLAPGSTVSFVTKEFSQATIPEPATLSLLGVGLGALGLAGIRRRKRQ